MTLLWLFCDNNVSINLAKKSEAELQNAAIIVAGSPFSGMPHKLAPGDSFVFGAETHSKLPIRVLFDADGRHYDIPSELRLAPFGSFVVVITVGEHFQISVETIFV